MIIYQVCSQVLNVARIKFLRTLGLQEMTGLISSQRKRLLAARLKFFHCCSQEATKFKGTFMDVGPLNAARFHPNLRLVELG